MSIKKDFERILKEAALKNDDAKKDILGICLSSDYTESGKRNAAESIQGDMLSYLENQKAAVNEAVKKKCEGLAAFEDLQLKKKNEDAEYQSLLASTLAILPAVAEKAEPEDLKNRLAPFKDDPLAISAIETVMKKAAEQRGPGQSKLINRSVLPENNRGHKAEQLQKLQKTMLEHLDNMAVSIEEKAFTSGDETAVYGAIRGGSVITATLNYIKTCNDDCTEFADSELYSGQIDPVNFEFGFNHIK